MSVVQVQTQFWCRCFSSRITGRTYKIIGNTTLLLVIGYILSIVNSVINKKQTPPQGIKTVALSSKLSKLKNLSRNVSNFSGHKWEDIMVWVLITTQLDKYGQKKKKNHIWCISWKSFRPNGMKKNNCLLNGISCLVILSSLSSLSSATLSSTTSLCFS